MAQVGEVVWEAPPEKRVSSKYDPLIRQLKERRGHWGRIRGPVTSGAAHSSAGNLRKRLKDDPHWQFRVALMDGEEDAHGLWGRYRTPEQLRADNGS